MPTTRPKPAEVAVEAKRKYFPFIAKQYPFWRPYSVVYSESEQMKHDAKDPRKNRKLLHVVMDADPVDVALDWHEVQQKYSSSGGFTEQGGQAVGIPIVNMANERRAGGDWESGLNAPEENMCRRSNLVQCLSQSQSAYNCTEFCIPAKGGVYSPNVVVFRSGPDQSYEPWSEFKALPVISVSPIRRPKLDASGQDYSFPQEKELMKEKIRTVLRIAIKWGHRDLCIGSFGAGPAFRNPPQQLARMWKDVLYTEPEFGGYFSNIVFAIERSTYGEVLKPVYDVFKEEFDPATVYRTSYR